jgi:ribose transport system ATP-binding protein
MPATTDETPALHLSGVSKTFDGVRALSSLDLTVQRGEVHALVGENGSGKSTAIKILSGFHDPDPGASITIAGTAVSGRNPARVHAAGARFVHQDLGLIHSQSVMDNFFLGGNGYPARYGTLNIGQMREATRTALAEIGLGYLDISLPVADLSPAQRAGVAIARALRKEPGTEAKLIVLDEPTATLAAHDVDELLQIVRTAASRGTGVMFVTHRLDEVFAVASRVSVLRDGHLVFTGDVADVTRDELVHHLLGSSSEAITSHAANTRPRTEVVLSVRHLTGERLTDVSFDACCGEVVGVAGITGSGREALCGMIYGASRPTSGQVTVGRNVLKPYRTDLAVRAGLAFLPGDRKTLGGFMELSAIENIAITDPWRFWSKWHMSRKNETDHVAAWFDRLDVRPRGAVDRKMAQFSGGNQQKLLFAKWLQRRPDVLLVDDPTQGVDVGAKVALHEHLIATAQSGTAIVVSSPDLDELVALCHRVLVMREGRIVEELVGAEIESGALGRACLAADSAGGMLDHQAGFRERGI